MAVWLAYLAFALSTLYVGLLLLFWVGIKRTASATSPGLPSVTVVVPAHNEAGNIPACLDALAAQDYPLDSLEVVLVDDRSTDGTAEVARSWVDRLPGLRILTTETQRLSCPKKNALEHGIRGSRGDLILTTDADCLPPPTWISATVRCFGADVGMVIGHAPLLSAGGPLAGVLSLQSLVVSALAAGSAGVGLPLTCSGRNLAYRRQTFDEVGGFEPIGHIRGGDDVLLMRRVSTRTNWRVRFNPEPTGGVPSVPHSDSVFRRQIRYQSKAPYCGIPILILAVAIYIFHAVLALGPAVCWADRAFCLPFGLALLAKLCADRVCLNEAARRFAAPYRLSAFLLMELVSVPYILVFCALGALAPNRLRWK